MNCWVIILIFQLMKRKHFPCLYCVRYDWVRWWWNDQVLIVYLPIIVVSRKTIVATATLLHWWCKQYDDVITKYFTSSTFSAWSRIYHNHWWHIFLYKKFSLQHRSSYLLGLGTIPQQHSIVPASQEWNFPSWHLLNLPVIDVAHFPHFPGFTGIRLHLL